MFQPSILLQISPLSLRWLYSTSVGVHLAFSRGVQDRGELSWHTSTTVYHPSAACHPWSSDVLHVGGSSRSKFCPGLSRCLDQWWRVEKGLEQVGNKEVV